MGMALPIPSLKNFKPDNSLRHFGIAKDSCFDHTLNVLVWNIFKGKGHLWQEDFRSMLEAQDLLILQEAVSNSEHDSLFDNSRSHEWIMARSYRNTRNGLETGVKTGAVSQSSGRKGFFSPDSEPVTNTPKLALGTTYPIRDCANDLMVLNVHAINFVSLKKYRNQLRQLQQSVEQHQGPLIVAGDFNTWNPARQAAFEEFRRACRLSEAKINRSARIQHLNQHLDHVCYRGLRLESIRTLQSIKSSDHYPIQANFKLPE